MYMVVRTWSNAGALADEMQKQEASVTDLIKGVPGFVAYYATRSGETLTSVTVCNTKEGVEQSTKVAGEWVKKNLPDAKLQAPQIAEGETFVQF